MVVRPIYEQCRIMSAKELEIKYISSAVARRTVIRHHYSGKVTQNGQIHYGVFYKGKLEGAMQYGPSIFRTGQKGCQNVSRAKTKRMKWAMAATSGTAAVRYRPMRSTTESAGQTFDEMKAERLQ